MRDLIIVSGISGAGKSQALKALEDLGYYCVDNILPQLIIEIANTVGSGSMQEFDKVALVVDTRGGEFFKSIYSILDLLKINGIKYRIVFLDANDHVLLNRFKETRRTHPLSKDGIYSEGIAKERVITAELKAQADIVIDTTDLAPRELKQKIYSIFGTEPASDHDVRLISFGFKRGAPADCDYVYDCRFMPNPFNDLGLRTLNGTDKRVADYAFSAESGQKLAENILELIRVILPDYKREVKAAVVVGVGCTGGKHRSVAMAERLAAALKKEGLKVAVQHRDMYID